MDILNTVSLESTSQIKINPKMITKVGLHFESYFRFK